MSQQNLVEFTISPEELALVNEAVATLQNILGPKMVTLSAQDRKEAVKLGDKSIAFVNKAAEYCLSKPNLVPQYLNVNDMNTDLNAVKSLEKVYNPLSRLVGQLNDTIFLSGSEAFNAALVYYASVKTAANQKIPEAQMILDDLAERFPGKRRNALDASTVS